MNDIAKGFVFLVALTLASCPLKVPVAVPPGPDFVTVVDLPTPDEVVPLPSEVTVVTLPDSLPDAEVSFDPIEVVAPHKFVPSVDNALLCHVCDKAEADAVHVKPKAQPVAIIGRTSFGTQYSNCANGNCGPVSGGRPRLFGRFR